MVVELGVEEKREKPYVIANYRLQDLNKNKHGFIICFKF